MIKYGYTLHFIQQEREYPYYWTKNGIPEYEKQLWLFNQKLDKILE